jgi:multicomponent Na+:H+ antiporter subunit B
MRSFLLGRLARGILPAMVLFAVYLLLRGHDAPGGGFIAGLVTTAAVVARSLAFGFEPTRWALRRLVRPAIWVGLLIAAMTGLAALARDRPFLTHDQITIRLSASSGLHLSTTLLFDLGVYLVVVGATVMALDALIEGPET